MKKILSLLVAVVFCPGIQAQIVSSRSVEIMTEKSKPSETIRFLRVGLNIMDFYGDGYGGDSNIGYNATIGYQKPLGNIGAYWGAEIGAGSRGFKFGSVKCIAHNIQCSPFTFGCKLGEANNLKIDAHAGAFLSYDYISKMKMDGAKSISWEDFAEDERIDYRPFDAGLNIGMGIWFDHFNLDFIYQFGFIDVFSDVDGMKTSNCIIRLGTAF